MGVTRGIGEFTQIGTYHDVEASGVFCEAEDTASPKTDIKTRLDTAVTDAAGKALFFPPGDYKIGTNISISNDVEFAAGARLDVQNGIVVTLTGNIKAGSQQIFTGAGTISFTGNRKLKETYPQWWGATGDGSTNDYSAINACLTASAGVCPVYFSKGTYLVGTALNPPSDTTIIGADRDNVIIRNHTDLGANRVFYVLGTSGTHKTNFAIRNLTIRNGTAGTTYSGARDGIRLEYVDGISIENCLITEIQGTYGICLKYCTEASIQLNKVYRFAYAGIFLLIECENIHVQDNTVDTCTATSGNAYGIGTGGETLVEGTFGVKNVWIERNKVNGVAVWDGILTHGGDGVWIMNNSVENVHTGIDASLSSGFWATPVMKNIVIEKNKCVQGTGSTNGYGIDVVGIDWNNDNNIKIRNNRTNGFGQTGGGANSIVGAITCYLLSDVLIEGNEVEEFNVTGISLYYGINGCKVLNNRIKNAVAMDTYSISYAIKATAQGVFNTFIDHNEITYDDTAKAIVRGISLTKVGGVICGQHNTINVTTAAFTGANTGYAIDPTTKYWKAGDIALTTDLLPSRGVNAGFGIFGWFDVALTMTVNATATESVATLTTPANYLAVPQFANVKIAGAGAGGTDLTTKVLKSNIDGTLTLADAIVTTVTGAAITMVAPTFTAY